MKLSALATALWLAVLTAAPAQAGGFAEQVMAPGVLADLPQGSSLSYDHVRLLPPASAGAELPGANRGIRPLDPIQNAVLQLTVGADDSGPMLKLGMTDDKASRQLASFRMAGPNPVLLYFLENTMRNMTLQTGGSPHYIRNAIRKDLSLAEPEPAENGLMRVVLHPFADDENAFKMGDYRDLMLTVTWLGDDPGKLVSLEAKAGGYLETLHLVPEE